MAETIIFIVLFMLSFGLGGYTVFHYYRMLHKAHPEEIKTPLIFKLKSIFTNVIIQKKLFKLPLRGIFHSIIFYGFIIYSIHTVSQFIGGFIGDIYFYLPSMAGDSIEYVYDYLLDFFSIGVLLGLVFFFSRRWILKAPELDRPSIQSLVIIVCISFLMLFTLAGEAGRMILLEKTNMSPIRHWIVQFYHENKISQNAEFIFRFCWWGHLITVFTLVIYVPRSKHAHLIWAPLNFFFARKTPKGAIRFLDIENSESWGAGNVQEFSWKGLLDGMSCIECGRCQLVCPASQTGKLLSPKDIMIDLKHSFMEKMHIFAEEEAQGTSKEELSSKKELRVIDNYISTESIWACTTCYACVEACPVGNDQVDSIIEMRRYLVLNEGKLPSELQNTLTNIENQSNPWGIGNHKREEWAEELDILTMEKWKESGKSPEVLFWVGCAGAFDDRNKKIVRSFASLLKKANISFGILGKEENCTGDSARRAGNEYLYQTLAQQNIDTLKKYNVQKIVTACPHCFNTIKNEYPQMGGNYTVEHHSVFLDRLVRENKLHIDPKKASELGKATYHDSCYLGRYNDNYNSPRNIVEKASTSKTVEPMERRSNSLCCGAGGAQMWKEEEKGNTRVNIERAKQLLDTEADTITTACPFCMTMVTDGVNSLSKNGAINTMDIAEFLEKSIDN